MRFCNWRFDRTGCVWVRVIWVWGGVIWRWVGVICVWVLLAVWCPAFAIVLRPALRTSTEPLRASNGAALRDSADPQSSRFHEASVGSSTG